MSRKVHCFLSNVSSWTLSKCPLKIFACAIIVLLIITKSDDKVNVLQYQISLFKKLMKYIISVKLTSQILPLLTTIASPSCAVKLLFIADKDGIAGL